MPRPYLLVRSPMCALSQATSQSALFCSADYGRQLAHEGEQAKAVLYFLR